jgi:hypothetical protein
VLASRGVSCAAGAGVAGAEVTIAAVVATGVAGVDEVHPAKNAVSTSSPHTIPMMMVCLVVTSCFMVNRSIVSYFSEISKITSVFFSKN